MTPDRTLVTALREHLRSRTGEAVSLIETHISWVLLTDGMAYKLKKPVRLSFVDFSTLAARKHYCEEELKLNRRLAPALYLEVAPVCGTPDAPYLGEIGEGGGSGAIDFVVCMRRFPEDQLLRNLLLAQQVDPASLVRFGQRLAGFHRDAQAAPLFSDFGSPEQVLRSVTGALDGLSGDPGGERRQALQTWVAEQGARLRTAWVERQRNGAVRECHGDLHLSNLVQIDGELTAFDCIEFDPALRWIDGMSDLAFLTMDLKAHRRGDLAFRVLDAYLQESGDYDGVPVLRFYEVYRALVRAMVTRLRAKALDEGSTDPDPDYLRCAEALAAGQAGRQGLLITHGLSGSGKSTVAARLLAAAQAIRIRSDVERKRLFGLAPLQQSTGLAMDIYTPDATRRTFERLAACTRTALAAGFPVIVDAAFLRRDERLAFRALATELRVPFTILHCQATDAQLRRRVAARSTGGTDASEADLAVLERQMAFQEPLTREESAVALEVATEEPLDIDALHARWLALAAPSSDAVSRRA